MTVQTMISVGTESGKIIPSGQVLPYLGHVIGGMIQVEWLGKKEIIHPSSTKELGNW